MPELAVRLTVNRSAMLIGSTRSSDPWQTNWDVAITNGKLARAKVQPS